MSQDRTNPTAKLDPKIRRRRILYRAWHRGTREMDFLLGTYVDRHIASLDDASLDRLEALMETDDQTLYRWVAGTIEVPVEFDTEILKNLRKIRLGTRDFTR